RSRRERRPGSIDGRLTLPVCRVGQGGDGARIVAEDQRGGRSGGAAQGDSLVERGPVAVGEVIGCRNAREVDGGAHQQHPLSGGGDVEVGDQRLAVDGGL